MSPRSPHATARSLLGEAQRSARPTPHRKDDAPTKAIFADGLLIEAAPIYLLRNMPCAARVIKIGVCGLLNQDSCPSCLRALVEDRVQ